MASQFSDNLMKNPLALAGLGIAQGRGVGDALNDAVATSYNYERQQAAQQQMERDARVQAALPGLLSLVQGKTPHEAVAFLTQAGIPIETALTIGKSLPQVKQPKLQLDQFGQVVALDQDNQTAQYVPISPAGGVASAPAGAADIEAAPAPRSFSSPAEKQEYDKAQGRLQAERDAAQGDKAVKAEGMLDLIQRAEGILPKASSGLLERGESSVNNWLGKSTDKTKADKQLKIISAGLVSNVPRMEGPQSNYDVELYRQAAGDIGNSDIPYEDRLAALQTVKSIQAKYAGIELPPTEADAPTDDDPLTAEIRRRGGLGLLK